MSDLFKIGAFSHLAQVTVRALRHYDARGLLRPAEVDRSTGYRYYALGQLPRLNRLLALKDLGFSLRQIGALLERDLPAEELRGMLAMRQAELADEVEDARRRLARVEARMRRIEHEGQPSPYEVVLKEVAPQHVASARRIVPHVEDMPAYRCSLFGAVYDYLAERPGATPGTELALYHNAAYVEEEIDMELAVAVESDSGAAPVHAPPPSGNGPGDPPQVCTRTLPGAGRMASTVHHGALPDVGQAITALFLWAGRNGYRAGGPYRQVNLFGREHEQCDVSDLVLEMQLPLEPLEQPAA